VLKSHKFCVLFYFFTQILSVSHKFHTRILNVYNHLLHQAKLFVPLPCTLPDNRWRAITVPLRLIGGYGGNGGGSFGIDSIRQVDAVSLRDGGPIET
jgi:hypothetical protein